MSLKKYNFIQEDLEVLVKQIDLHKLANLKNSHVYITGVSGFVGLWVVNFFDYLNKNADFNIRVTGLDRNLDKISALAPSLLSRPQLKFIKNDVRNVTEIPKDTDYILHLAGSPDSQLHATQPVDVMTSIAAGTTAILTAADRLSNLKMFVNMSSALVYGDIYNRTQALKESDSILVKSLSPYISAKIYSESLTTSFRQQYRIPALSVRPFTFVGPFQTLSSPWAINNFMRDTLSGGTIKVLGTGKTVRSFLYGSDVALWLTVMMLFGSSGEMYNLGSDEQIELGAVAKLVADCFAQPKEIQYCVGQASMHRDSYLVPDNSLIETKFGLKPTVGLSQAIKRSIEWHMIDEG